jgi:KilA-N domain
MDLTIKTFNNRDIRINPNTRYVCLTDMAAANGKLFGHWQELKSSTDYLEALSSAIVIPIDALLFVGEGNLGTWAHPKVAIRFAQWCSIEFAIQVDAWIDELLTKGQVQLATALEQDRQTLEKQIRPEPSTQNRLDAIKILKAGGHQKSYIQRVTIQMAKAICPGIEVPQPTELISLPTARALLTPTQLAVELKLLFSTGAGDGSKVNKLLEQLGYQVKVANVWSATDKAIQAKLVDRKPVETNSRTQKDQLLWSVDVLVILQEHTASVG